MSTLQMQRRNRGRENGHKIGRKKRECRRPLMENRDPLYANANRTRNRTRNRTQTVYRPRVSITHMALIFQICKTFYEGRRDYMDFLGPWSSVAPYVVDS
jgi:hypothetical protein